MDLSRRDLLKVAWKIGAKNDPAWGRLIALPIPKVSYIEAYSVRLVRYQLFLQEQAGTEPRPTAQCSLSAIVFGEGWHNRPQHLRRTPDVRKSSLKLESMRDLLLEEL